MGIPQLLKSDIKELLFEFHAKEGDGCSPDIRSFCSGWLLRKLKLPSMLTEAVPGGHGHKQIDTSRELRKRYEDMSWQAAEELVKEGLLMPDRTQQQYTFYKITEKGRTLWQGQGKLGFTASDLVERLKISGSSIDNVTLAFLDEACKALQERLPIASIVLLGIASEKAILEMEDSLLEYLNNPNLTSRHRTKITSILKRVGEIQDLFKKHRKQIIQDYSQEVDPSRNINPVISDLHSYLGTIFQIIRIARNEHAHPELHMPLDRNSLLTDVEAYLRASKNYFDTIFEVKDILDSVK